MRNYRITTPAGEIRAAVVDGETWFCIKDIYEGFGYDSHTPWSWHRMKDDNAHRYYRRYSLATGHFVDNPKQRGAIAVINIEGLYSILRLDHIRENPVARQFHGWLARTYPNGESNAAEASSPKSEQISMFEKEAIAHETEAVG